MIRYVCGALGIGFIIGALSVFLYRWHIIISGIRVDTIVIRTGFGEYVHDTNNLLPFKIKNRQLY
jgi:hypothetical protein